MQEKRVEEYDLLRVMLTILVVVGHATYRVMHTQTGGVDWPLPADIHPSYFSRWRSLLDYLVQWIYTFHMPLFMMLSGAVSRLGKTYDSFPRLAAKKALRLLLPFYACGLLFMLPVKALGGFYTPQSLGKAALNLILLGDDMGHLWFLFSLFLCFVAFLPLKKYLLRIHWALVVLPLFLLRSVFRHFALPTDVGLGMLADSLPFFALGFVVAGVLPRIRARFKSQKILYLMLPLLLAFSVCNFVWDILPNTFTVLLNSALLYLFCLFLSQVTSLANTRFIRLLASYSFYVYLFHDPLEYLVLRLFFATSMHTTALGCVLYTLLRIAGVVLVSAALGWALRRLGKLIKRIPRRKSA